MSLDGTIELPWGGDERRFRLAMAQLLALEERRDCAFAEIHLRLARGQWGIADVCEVLRLGLIGGGTSERAARELVERCCVPGDLQVAADVALCVLTAALDAPKGAVLAGKPMPASAGTQPSVSASPPSTGTP